MWFYIQNIATGLVLDIKDNDRDGKGEVITYPYHGGNNQLFAYENNMIYCKLNGYVLHVTSKDSRVILHPPKGGSNQKWTFDDDFTIKNELGNVLDVAKKGNKISGDLIAYRKHGGTNQKFRRVYV